MTNNFTPANNPGFTGRSPRFFHKLFSLIFRGEKLSCYGYSQAILILI